MATYDRREVVARRVEFVVPAPYSWGANVAEVMKAVRAAEAELRTAGREIADDTITFTPSDECVIVSYVVGDETAPPR